LGLNNQRLAVNGVFHASDRSDAVACAIEALGQLALDEMPQALKDLPQDRVPLRAFDTVGLPALRALLSSTTRAGAPVQATTAQPIGHVQGLAALADELAAAGHGLIMVMVMVMVMGMGMGMVMVMVMGMGMGMGGVGKTTVAPALALGLNQRGKTVHLGTTDPAAHLAVTLNCDVPGLQVSRIDPKVETERYIDKIMAAKSPGLDARCCRWSASTSNRASSLRAVARPWRRLWASPWCWTICRRGRPGHW
jgi:arsenite-transporting ATPase